MKVMIIKASDPLFWYADKIGQVFEVEKDPESLPGYQLYICADYGRIFGLDCKIVEE